jgi:hypothetical protein
MQPQGEIYEPLERNLAFRDYPLILSAFNHPRQSTSQKLRSNEHSRRSPLAICQLAIFQADFQPGPRAEAARYNPNPHGG